MSHTKPWIDVRRFHRLHRGPWVDHEYEYPFTSGNPPEGKRVPGIGMPFASRATKKQIGKGWRVH